METSPKPSGPARTLELALRALVQLAVGAPALLGASALAVSFRFTPDEVGGGAHYAALGLPVPACPGCAMCGMSRAFSAASHGELGRALDLNPLVVLAYPGALVATAACIFALVFFVKHPITLRPRPRTAGSLEE